MACPFTPGAQGPLATWIERETCGSILGHLQLGFRLDLYQPAVRHSGIVLCDCCYSRCYLMPYQPAVRRCRISL